MDIEDNFVNKQTQTLKNLITQILRTNTAYDCMAINSSISSISKNSSLYDAINIIINQNIQQLLVWDESLNRWIWMLTIVDAIRLIMHSLKTIIKQGRVNFALFQDYREKGVMGFEQGKNQQFTKEQILLMLQTFQNKKISEIILEINQPVSRKYYHEQLIGKKIQSSKLEKMQPQYNFGGQSHYDEAPQHYNYHLEKQLSAHQPLYSSKKPPLPPSTQRPYIRLKSVVKQSKLSYVIMAMIVQKIHRILIEDIESKMIVSILNFKDILLYLLRIANQSDTQFYNKVTMASLLETTALSNNIQIKEDRPLWEAFELMTDVHRSLWINVVDETGMFKGLLFRQDFRDIFTGWHINYLWMSAGQFIKLKQKNSSSNVPEYRFFTPEDVTKQIIWKIVMTKGNTIVWVDQNQGNKPRATIGLMELFNLFVH